jgi:hypothetical protein
VRYLGSSKSEDKAMITDTRSQDGPISDAVQLRHRSALINSLADRAQVIATVRAAANVTAWRAYLPEDCVVAMIKDGWHWST